MITRILLLSYYYPPDLSAGSFRAEALVNALLEEMGERVQIDVITTQPNRYHSYIADAAGCESSHALNIRRIAVPTHRSGILDQARAFATYAYGVHRLVRSHHYDLVFATSSRLMTATLGALVARRSKSRLYLDIRDIFVDTLPELFPSKSGKLAAMVFSPIERWTIHQATRVNLISPGFLPYFSTRYPDKQFTLYTNGVDELFLDSPAPVPQLPAPLPSQRLRVVYAGNIGTGQGLHLILPELAKRLEHKVEFRIIGSGGALDKLELALKRAKVTNVSITPPMKRDELLIAYHQADVLFLHLNSLKAFRRVLPSKLFEYAATHKPIWAGLSGFAGRFATKKIKNVALFTPCDINGAVLALEKLNLHSISRLEFIEQFSRTSIKKQMAQDVLRTSPKYLKNQLAMKQKKATIS